VGLCQPLRAAGVADPYREGVVVEGLNLGGPVVGRDVAGEAAENVICSEGGVRRENAYLKVAELVGGEFAVSEEDESCIESLNSAVDLDVIGGEEALDGFKIALGKGGPEMLFLSDDFYRGRWRGQRLCTRLGDGRDREECSKE
jgi:hypothetical protein